MPSTYPGSPTLTVDALLKQPEIISRALTSLASKRFVADRIFTRGTGAQVAGGGARYQKSESIYTDRDAEEVGVRAEFPRAAWSEALYTAEVKQYGLEVPINELAIRRSQMDVVARAERKLANAVVKFIDTKAMTLITTDADVQTFAASGDWSTAATDIVADLAEARRLIDVQSEGYEADTLIVNPAQLKDLLVDKDIRDAMPRETSDSTVQTGRIPNLRVLGLELIVTPNLTAGTALVLQSKIVGTIADETPDAAEGYTGYDPGEGQSPIYVKVYDEPQGSDKIVRAARWPAMWLAEPKSAVKLTSA